MYKQLRTGAIRSMLACIYARQAIMQAIESYARRSDSCPSTAIRIVGGAYTIVFCWSPANERRAERRALCMRSVDDRLVMCTEAFTSDARPLSATCVLQLTIGAVRREASNY